MGYVLGLSEINAAFDKIVAETEVASRAIVAESAAVVEAKAKANFAGAHKRGAPHTGGSQPNVVTGTLRRSIGHDGIHSEGIGGASARVGPRTIYARRVELGFTGTDAAGRTFNQPGYPYFVPAVRDTRDQVEAIARRRWTASTRAR